MPANPEVGAVRNPMQPPSKSHSNKLLEASLAPREGELLSLPFDQYGRMRIVENVALILRSEIVKQSSSTRLSVLDVGGYPGILRNFLPGELYDISVLDVVPDDGSIPGYSQGSGLDLPYEQDSFDVLTSLDTLEHIPNEHRPKFLSEIMRVARHGVVLINPIQSTEADLAEEVLDEYIRWILDAQQEQLAEHRQFGLPDYPGTITAFQDAGWQTTHFPTANLYNWLFMMVAKHYLISMRDEKASAFERTLDRFYNLTFSESDHTTPAYRGVIVAVRPGLEGALGRIDEMYPPVESGEVANLERLQLTNLLMSMLDLKVANHEDRRLREQMDRRDRHIAGLEANTDNLEQQLALKESKILEVAALGDTYKEHIKRLEEEQRNKNEHILYLEKLLQGIESGRVMRLTRTLSRFIGR